jgi:hypothetical protein
MWYCFYRSPRAQSESHIHISSLWSSVQRIQQGLSLYCDFRNKFIFYSVDLLANPSPKIEGHPLSFVHGCLFSIFATTLHWWRPFLHLQPEDAPCCGDRDPSTMYWLSNCLLVLLKEHFLTKFHPCSGICVTGFLSLHKLLIALVMLCISVLWYISNYKWLLFFFHILSSLPSAFFQLQCVYLHQTDAT